MTQISELFSVLVDWVVSRGGDMPGKLPGVWRGETDDWNIACNGSAKETRENIPPLSFHLQHKTALLSMAIVNPFGGAIVGTEESALIEHFKSRTPAQIGGAA